MAKHARPRTIALPWRRVCAALPSIALIGGGIAVTAPIGALNGVFLPKGPAPVVVPDTALTMHRVPADPFGPATQKTPDLVLPDGSNPGSALPDRSSATPTPAHGEPAPDPNPPPGAGRQPAPGPGAPTTGPTTAPPQPSPVPPWPSVPIPGPTSTATGSASTPLTRTICTSGPLVVQACSIVPLP